jgi:transitional endoplasmic reticulum ATPase
MVGVEIAPGKFEQVVWGDVQVPDIKGVLTTGVTKRDGMPRFLIQGTVLQKYVGQVKKIAELTRKIVREESIYRGNAVRLSSDANGQVNFQNDLKFLDVSNVNEDELVFPDETMEQIEVNLFTPIENAEECRKHKIPLSRKVLFEGPFGVGKTITAYVAAKKATQRGWTFIYLDRVAGLKDALLFAKQYAPAVLFAEDIDRITTGDRDSKTDDVLNTIDGADTKGCEILTILTTNNVENIHQAMLRPGRLDAVISVRAPDAKAVQKLVRIYSRDRLPKDEDITEVGAELAGQIPAVIREVVERSKLYAIGRAKSSGTEVQISGTDLARSARGMKMHLQFLNRENKEPSLAERFTASFVEVMNTSAAGVAADKDMVPTHAKVTKLCQKAGIAIQ